MFTEILRVKPVLDSASTKQMEATLAGRFQTVAKRFGAGLKAAVKGTILGIGLGLLAKLLNPLQELEDKVKKLLDQGKDVGDLADRLGAKPAELLRLQATAQTLGIKPDELKDLLLKFADGIETARKELQDPFAQRSASTVVLEDFAKNPNMVKSFQDFLERLRVKGEGPGRDLVFGEKQQRLALERMRTGGKLSDEERQRLIAQGVLKPITGLESRQLSEEAIFGKKLTGFERGLVEATPNLAATADRFGLPSEQKINRAFNQNAKVGTVADALAAKNSLTDFIAASNQLTTQMATSMAARDKAEQDRINQQFKNFETLKQAQKAIDTISNVLLDIRGLILNALSLAKPAFDFIEQLRKSPFIRKLGIGSGGK